MANKNRLQAAYERGFKAPRGCGNPFTGWSLPELEAEFNRGANDAENKGK